MMHSYIHTHQEVRAISLHQTQINIAKLNNSQVPFPKKICICIGKLMLVIRNTHISLYLKVCVVNPNCLLQQDLSQVKINKLNEKVITHGFTVKLYHLLWLFGSFQARTSSESFLIYMNLVILISYQRTEDLYLRFQIH